MADENSYYDAAFERLLFLLDRLCVDVLVMSVLNVPYTGEGEPRSLINFVCYQWRAATTIRPLSYRVARH